MRLLASVQFGKVGAGDVAWSGTVAIDRGIAIFNGTTGKVVQTTGVTISPTGVISGVNLPLLDTDVPNKWYVDNIMAGGGDVKGPSGVATSGAVALFDGLTGKWIKTSLVTINSSGDVNIPAGRKYYIGSVQLSVGDVYGSAPLAYPVFSGYITTPAIKIVTGAGLGKVLTSNALGEAYWSSLAPGTGDVTGQTTSEQYGVAVYADATGKVIRDNGATIDLAGIMRVPRIRTNATDYVDIYGLSITALGASTNPDLSIAAQGTGRIFLGSGINPLYVNGVLYAAGGDVTGLTTSELYGIAVYAGTTGKVIRDNGATVDLAGIMRVTQVRTNGADFIGLSGLTFGAGGTSTNVDVGIYAKGTGKIWLGSGTNPLYINGVLYTGMGSGDVVGPSGVAAGDAIVLFNGLTGKLIKTSSFTIDGANQLRGGTIIASIISTAPTNNNIYMNGSTLSAGGTAASGNLYLNSYGAGSVIYLNTSMVCYVTLGGSINANAFFTNYTADYLRMYGTTITTGIVSGNADLFINTAGSGSIVIKSGSPSPIYLNTYCFVDPSGNLYAPRIQLSTSPVPGYFLKCNDSSGNGVWAAGGGGSGNVTGPLSSTTNAIARYSDTLGKTIKNSAGVTIDDVSVLTASSFRTAYGDLDGFKTAGPYPINMYSSGSYGYISCLGSINIVPGAGSSLYLNGTNVFLNGLLCWATNTGTIVAPAFTTTTATYLTLSGTTLSVAGSSSVNLNINSYGAGSVLVFNSQVYINMAGALAALNFRTQTAQYIDISGTTVLATAPSGGANLILSSTSPGIIYLNVSCYVNNSGYLTTPKLYLPTGAVTGYILKCDGVGGGCSWGPSGSSIQVQRGTPLVPAAGIAITFSTSFPGTPTVVATCMNSGNTVMITYVSTVGFGMICNRSCQGCNVAVSDYVSWVAIYS